MFEERREREKRLKGLLVRQMIRSKFFKNKSSLAKGFAMMRGYAIGASEAAQLDNSAAADAALQEQVFTLTNQNVLLSK